MNKLRTGILTGLAITAMAATGAAPASAQETSPFKTPPPCTPGVPLPDGVNCTFELAVWALEQVDPVYLLRYTQAETNAAILRVQEETVKALQFVDDAQKVAVGTACAVIGIEPENCPQI